jgi:internalin A
MIKVFKEIKMKTTRIIQKCIFILIVSSALFAVGNKAETINYFKSKGGYVLSNGTGLQFSSESSIADNDLKHLKDLPDLETLSLNSNITNEGLRYVSTSKNLTALHLSETKITDEGLKYIKNLDKLEFLFLDDTSITDAGLKHLLSLSNLLALWLQNTNITDEGVSSLTSLQKLETLYLSGTKITDKSLNSLETFKNLVELRVGKTKITAAGIASLKKKLPHCRIFND